MLNTYRTIILIKFGIFQNSGITAHWRCTHTIIYLIVHGICFANFQNIFNSLKLYREILCLGAI